MFLISIIVEDSMSESQPSFVEEEEATRADERVREGANTTCPNCHKLLASTVFDDTINTTVGIESE